MGHERLIYALYGDAPHCLGELRIDGKLVDLRALRPGAAYQLGLRLVPSERLLNGAVSEATVRENASLPDWSASSSNTWICPTYWFGWSCSTSFAQWTTREALRRAQPLTLLVRFAPRQRQRPMNELLSDTRSGAEVDPIGSLVDADMAAYYHWINQQRLAGYDRSAFLVWFEGQNQALVIGPTMPRGATSSSEVDLSHLLALALG